MPLAEALQVTLEVVRTLDRLGVPYLLGGSLASSLHGIPRTTQDSDLVADLQEPHAAPLVAALQARFYIDEERVRGAIRRRKSFNVIHLATLTKVDIFVLKDDALSRQELVRRQRVSLPGEEEAWLYVASPEDTVLQKLAWFDLGSGVSEQQWNDILGVLKVQRGRLDHSYLSRWAHEIGVEELLRKALSESGIEPEG